MKLVLVALKCDLREKHADEDDETDGAEPGRPKEKKEFIDYNQGLEVARRIQALRYLGTVSTPCHGMRCDAREMLTPSAECSAKRNRGVNEAFTEAARVALSVKGTNGSQGIGRCSVM